MFCLQFRKMQMQSMKRLRKVYKEESKRDVIQQYCIFIYIFADYFNIILHCAGTNQKPGAAAGEPFVLCMGRTGLYISDDFLYYFQLCQWIGYCKKSEEQTCEKEEPYI